MNISIFRTQDHQRLCNFVQFLQNIKNDDLSFHFAAKQYQILDSKQMKKVSLFSELGFQDRFNNQNIFGSSKTKKVERSMMFSRIECQPKEKGTENKYIIHKIAKANKHKIAQYLQRIRNGHPNLLEVEVDQTSSFYATIRVEKGESFQFKHLLMQQTQKRSQFLKVILLTAKFLSDVYGYFYITEKMLLYRNSGAITLWINENILENYCSHPINHSKMSEQFFISDFKANFIGNFRQAKALQKAKTIDNILCILHQEKKIFQSIYMSQPTDKMSQIHRGFSLQTNSIISCRDLGGRYHQKKDYGSVIFNKGLNNMKKSISFSYLPSQIDNKINARKKSFVKTLSNSISADNLRQRRESSNNIKLTSNSVTFSNIMNLSSSSKNIRSSNLPIINFSYSKLTSHNEGWKKKKENIVNKQCSYSMNFMSKSQSMGSIAPNFERSRPKEPLQISFPNKISNSLIPYENSDITKKEQSNRDESEIIETNIFHNIKRQELKNQQATQLQMDLQVLFSDSQGEVFSQEQMDTIMEEFQNILLS